jgi:hypothetical protein
MNGSGIEKVNTKGVFFVQLYGIKFLTIGDKTVMIPPTPSIIKYVLKSKLTISAAKYLKSMYSPNKKHEPTNGNMYASFELIASTLNFKKRRIQRLD